jgi:hypothetical protein
VRVASLAAILLALLLPAAVQARPVHRTTTLTTLSRTEWRTWWGAAAYARGAVTLSSTPPLSPAETHSALVTSHGTWRDPTISVTTKTLRQLRTGSAANPWECGWVMFRFRDLSHYYWFTLKPNGFELGKKQGSLDQIFLATGSSPALPIGHSARIRIVVRGARIQVYAGTKRIVDYTDPKPLARAGSVGLYEEDSAVHFGSLAISGT